MTNPKQFKTQPIAAAMKLTNGNSNDAILLFDIWNFFPHSKAKRKNRKVIVLTDQQLCERTGLTLSQIRRAKRRLVETGLIEAEQGISANYHGGRNVTHIHIPEEVLRRMAALIIGAEQKCLSPLVHSKPSQALQKCATLLIKEENKSEASAGLPTWFDEAAQLEKMKELFGE